VPDADRYSLGLRFTLARNLSVDKVQALIADMTQDRFLGVLGEKRVNVLKLNSRWINCTKNRFHRHPRARACEEIPAIEPLPRRKPGPIVPPYSITR